MIPSKPKIVREVRIEEIRVEDTGQGRRPGESFLIAATVRKEKSVIVSPVLIDSKTHGGISNRVAGPENEVVLQAVQTSGNIGTGREKGQHSLRNWIDATGDLIARESRAALYWVSIDDDSLSRRWVENLTQ